MLENVWLWFLITCFRFCAELETAQNEAGLLCLVCNRTSCMRDVVCSSSSESCYLVWTRGLEGDVIVGGGCYGGANDQCGSECVAGPPLENPRPLDALTFFCCCKRNRCNEAHQITNEVIVDKPSGGRTRFDGTTSLVISSCLFPFVLLVIVYLVFLVTRMRKRRRFANHLLVPLFKKGPSQRRSPKKTLLKRMPTAIIISTIYQSTHTKILKAFTTKDSKPVAVKVYDFIDISGWKKECKMYLYYKISHKNITKCLGAGLNRIETVLDEGKEIPDNSLFNYHDEKLFNYFLMFEFNQMGSLDYLLQQNSLSIEQIFKIIHDICSGLDFLHIESSGNNLTKPIIIHRDLKASNVLVRNDGSCCISDFGLAVDLNPGFHKERFTQCGTVRYMAPEILECCVCYQRDILPMIDMYSFSLIIWELLSRCRECEGSQIVFERAFQKEIGLQPSKETAYNLVIECKYRPVINPKWREDQILFTLQNIMTECWDYNPEARISSKCALERLNNLYS